MQGYRGEKWLWELAEQDDIYMFWKTTLEMCEKPFKEYVETCPEEIRGILYGYADSGRMMCQRVVNLAFEYLGSSEEDKK